MQNIILWAAPILITLIVDCASQRMYSPRLTDYGGHEVEIEDIPYIVSIVRHNNHMCGGVIIDEQWVITTAHCVENLRDLEIQAGLINLTFPGKYLQKRRVVEVILHPSYDHSNTALVYDLALLKLNKRLLSNLAVEPISILTTDQLERLIFNEEPALIAGWGYSRSADAAVSDKLFSGQVTLLGDGDCENGYRNCGVFVAGIHLCSTIAPSAEFVGYLDEGGPLVFFNKLAGLILHGKYNKDETCPQLSAVYARVPSASSFIRTYIPHLFPSDEDELPAADESGSESHGSLKLELIFNSVKSTDPDRGFQSFGIFLNPVYSDSCGTGNQAESISTGNFPPEYAFDFGNRNGGMWIFTIEFIQSIEPTRNSFGFFSLLFSRTILVTITRYFFI